MSEALRLADALELPMHESVYYRHAAAAELRRLHAEHTEIGQALKRASERINELEAELAEQARVNGMGGEREARLMAELERKSDAIQRLWKERDELRTLNTELVEALRRCRDMVAHPDNLAFIDAALAKVEASK